MLPHVDYTQGLTVSVDRGRYGVHRLIALDEQFRPPMLPFDQASFTSFLSTGELLVISSQCQKQRSYIIIDYMLDVRCV